VSQSTLYTYSIIPNNSTVFNNKDTAVVCAEYSLQCSRVENAQDSETGRVVVFVYFYIPFICLECIIIICDYASIIFVYKYA